MVKKKRFPYSFLVSGVMCYEGCGFLIDEALKTFLEESKAQGLFPSDCEICIDAEPAGLGLQKFIITLSTDDEAFSPKPSVHESLVRCFTDYGFTIASNEERSPKKESKWWSRINFIINLLAIIAIIVLPILFPPSLPLAIGLASISFIASTFSARNYLIKLWHSIKNRRFSMMATSVGSGWFLANAHLIYHLIVMPLALGMSMIVMNFLMPVLLLTAINVMDLIKSALIKKSAEMNLSTMKSLFPELAEQYQRCDCENTLINKELIQPGMRIIVKRGQCFPVDGQVVEGKTRIDASVITGEHSQFKQVGDEVPAGCINLGHDVILEVINDSYHSTTNKLLFVANRADKQSEETKKSNNYFSLFYSALIVIGLISAIVIPAVLGIITLPLVLQNLTGILFAVCPCTLAIAHELPQLISLHNRSKRQVHLKKAKLHTVSPHTYIFDKTGTLTTGESEVVTSVGITKGVWQRVYLAEKHCAAEHPLAKAIIHCYEKNSSQQSLINTVGDVQYDEENRGFSALIQAKRIHIGNEKYFRDNDIVLPRRMDAEIEHQINLGHTPVYISEEGKFKGAIFIKHKLRPGTASILTRLKHQGKKLILLTGDTEKSAQALNSQLGGVFTDENKRTDKTIFSGRTPEQKEKEFEKLISEDECEANGVWFIGDGLNDAPCARKVSEAGGVSCAIGNQEKAVFFSDISLNNSLDYLLVDTQLNRFTQKTKKQNQALILLSSLLFIGLLIAMPLVGVSLSPLIPVLIMGCTTGFTIYNSWRNKIAVESALDDTPSLPKKMAMSDFNLLLLVTTSCFLIACLFPPLLTIAAIGLAVTATVFIAVNMPYFICTHTQALSNPKEPLITPSMSKPCIAQTEEKHEKAFFLNSKPDEVNSPSLVGDKLTI